MGWALPASIGAAFARPAQRIFCIIGDGSLLMSIQELATVVHHQLPIVIFLINNNGFSMIQQTQDQWLNSKYIASTREGGLALPQFRRVAEAYGLPTIALNRNQNISSVLRDTLKHGGPIFCDVEIRREHRVVPQAKFGRPNEDQEPLLPRPEFFQNMTVKPLAVSLTMDDPVTVPIHGQGLAGNPARKAS
jgi:acetolactate synthase-1/2/3 large subunit